MSKRHGKPRDPMKCQGDRAVYFEEASAQAALTQSDRGDVVVEQRGAPAHLQMAGDVALSLLVTRIVRMV